MSAHEHRGKGFIYSSQRSLFSTPDVVGFGDDELRVAEVNRDTANAVIVKNHYSHKYYAASYIHLGVYAGQALSGVLQFGYAMNPASAASVVEGTGLDEYLELNRMWVDDALPRNTESRIISYAIKYIRARYPKIKWVQSFADERCGRFGVVYQAANFQYYGEHVATFWTLNDEVYHNSLMTRDPKLSKAAAHLQENRARAVPSDLRQFRYIYFIDRRVAGNCKFKKQDYPKHGTFRGAV